MFLSAAPTLTLTPTPVCAFLAAIPFRISVWICHGLQKLSVLMLWNTSSSTALDIPSVVSLAYSPHSLPGQNSLFYLKCFQRHPMSFAEGVSYILHWVHCPTTKT